MPSLLENFDPSEIESLRPQAAKCRQFAENVTDEWVCAQMIALASELSGEPGVYNVRPEDSKTAK